MSCQALLALCVAALLCGAYGQIMSPIISPPVIAGEVGDTVAFYCDSQFLRGGSSISLDMYDPIGDSFVSFDNSTGRLMRVNDDTLANFTFGPLTPADNGIILICNTQSGDRLSGNATISVLFMPIVTAITPLDMPIVLREDVSVVIQLNVSGNPQPTFSWRQVGSDMPLSNGSGVTVTIDTLTFNNIGRERTGQYVYEAVNRVGRSNISFELDVQFPPEFPAEVYSPNTLNCTRQGQYTTCASYPGIDITFRCSASGNPMPEIGVQPMPLGPNVQTVDNDIVITSVTRENAGNYSCTASSSQFPDSNVTRYFELFVGGTPFPLGGLTVMVTNTSIIVTWTYNNSANTVPATYLIANVSLNGIPITTPLPQIDVNRMSVVIPSAALEGEQTYMVSVVARNLQGDSQPVTAEFTTPRSFSGATGLHASSMFSLLLIICAMLAFL